MALAALSFVPVLFILLLAGSMILGGAFHTVTTPPVRFIPVPAQASPSPTAKAVFGGLGQQPMDVAVDSSGKRLYTANYVSGDVTVIDTASMSVAKTIDVPGTPIGVTVSGGTVYVADRKGKKVYAVDSTTGRTVATFKAGGGPADVTVDPGAHRLFVLNADAGTIWVYDLRTHRRVGTIPSYGSISIAVDTAEHKLYSVASLGVLWVYRTTTLVRLGDTYVGSPGAVAVDSKRQRLYILSNYGLQERNLLTGKTRSIDTDIHAQSIAIDPLARKAYIADPDTNVGQALSLK